MDFKNMKSLQPLDLDTVKKIKKLKLRIDAEYQNYCWLYEIAVKSHSKQHFEAMNNSWKIYNLLMLELKDLIGGELVQEDDDEN